MNPSSGHFPTDAVVPSSDHCCIVTVALSGGHFFTETVAPSNDHYYSDYCYTEIVAPSSEHYSTKSSAPVPPGYATVIGEIIVL